MAGNKKTTSGNIRELKAEDFENARSGRVVFTPLYQEPEKTEPAGKKKRSGLKGKASKSSSKEKSSARDYSRDSERSYSRSSERSYSRSAERSYNRDYERVSEPEERETRAPKKERYQGPFARFRGALNTGEFAELGNPHEPNFAILACVILLLVIGTVMVTSSSYYYAFNTQGDSLFFLKKQIVFIGLGTIALVAFNFIPLNFFYAATPIAYAASVAMNVAVLFWGVEVNGQTRWLDFKIFQIQPSEISKIMVPLMLAYCKCKFEDRVKEFNIFLLMCAIIGAPTALVLKGNLSSAAIIGLIGFITLVVCGCDWKHLTGLMILVLLAGFLMLVLPYLADVNGWDIGILRKFATDVYRIERIKAYIDPFKYRYDEGYQTVQSLYAVGSGGFFGRGLGESIQKIGFIPEAYNDIIFAVICEELGFLGAALIVGLVMVLVWRSFQVASIVPSTFCKLIAAAIGAQIGLQTIMNIAVNTNLMPPTGVTLPFISYGGTALVILLAEVGLLLNISQYAYRRGKKRA